MRPKRWHGARHPWHPFVSPLPMWSARFRISAQALLLAVSFSASMTPRYQVMKRQDWGRLRLTAQRWFPFKQNERNSPSFWKMTQLARWLATNLRANWLLLILNTTMKYWPPCAVTWSTSSLSISWMVWRCPNKPRTGLLPCQRLPMDGVPIL